MSKEALEKLRTNLAAQREETFRTKLAALVAEMETAKRLDDVALEGFTLATT